MTIKIYNFWKKCDHPKPVSLLPDIGIGINSDIKFYIVLFGFMFTIEKK